MPATEEWARLYETGYRLGWTFRRTAATFRFVYRCWPSRGLPLMPANEIDWFRRICDVRM